MEPVKIHSKLAAKRRPSQIAGKLSPTKLPKRAGIPMESPGHWRLNKVKINIYDGSINQMYRICNDGPAYVMIVPNFSSSQYWLGLPAGSCCDVIGRDIVISWYADNTDKAAGTYERIPMPKPFKSGRVGKASKNAKESR
jgi:hypothetical protein